MFNIVPAVVPVLMATQMMNAANTYFISPLNAPIRRVGVPTSKHKASEEKREDVAQERRYKK